jgi:hypothetical protein
LIENNIKGKNISLFTSFGISSMKRLIETEHVELVISYVEEDIAYNISRS